ncbi:unnamed protein product, partial [Staurois parvus]
TQQHVTAGRRETYVVYTQVSPLSVILGDHRLLVGNLWPGHGDRHL